MAQKLDLVADCAAKPHGPTLLWASFLHGEVLIGSTYFICIFCAWTSTRLFALVVIKKKRINNDGEDYFLQCFSEAVEEGTLGNI